MKTFENCCSSRMLAYSESLCMIKNGVQKGFKILKVTHTLSLYIFSFVVYPKIVLSYLNKNTCCQKSTFQKVMLVVTLDIMLLQEITNYLKISSSVCPYQVKLSSVQDCCLVKNKYACTFSLFRFLKNSVIIVFQTKKKLIPSH